MEVLDGGPHDTAAERSKLDRVIGLLNGGKDWGWLSRPVVKNEYSPGLVQKANSQFTRSLRALVDQWIDSGRDPEGREAPTRRDINIIPPGYTEPLFDMLHDWLRSNKPPAVLRRSGKIAVVVKWPDIYGIDPFDVREGMCNLVVQGAARLSLRLLSHAVQQPQLQTILRAYPLTPGGNQARRLLQPLHCGWLCGANADQPGNAQEEASEFGRRRLA